MRQFKVLAAAAVLCCLMACGGAESEETLLARASEALANGQVNAAIIDVKAALQQNPTNPAARRLLGEAYLLQRNLAAAREELERALPPAQEPADETGAVEPATSLDAVVLYARVLVEAREFDTLFAIHNEARWPGVESDPVYNAALARALAQTGDINEAAEKLDAALQTGAGLPYVRISKAIVDIRRNVPLDEVRAELNAVLEDQPRDDSAWSLLGDLARFNGEPAAAAEAYAEAAKLNPFRLGERLNLISMYLESEDFEAARAEVSAVAKVLPDHPGIAFARARLLLQDADTEGALVELNKVLAALPNHPPSLYLAGMVNAQQGNLSTALRQLQRYLRDQPQNLAARQQLANVHLRLDDPRSAATVAREILEENSMDIPALRILAVALSLQGLHAESAQVYQQVATLEPQAVDARVGLSNAQLLAGNVSSGVDELKAALALEPENPGLNERLVSVYLATGAVEEAREAAAAYLALDPDNVRAQLISGRAALQAGDEEAAEQAFAKVLALEPGNVDANGGLAALALLNEDLDTARERFGDALAASPDNLNVLMNLAIIEETAGNLEAMTQMLERAVSAHPEVLAPRLALARFRLADGRGAEAVELLEGMVAQHADTFVLHQILARAHLANNEPARALDNAAALLRLQPTAVPALLLAARVEQRAGRLDPAREHLDAVLEQEADNTEARGLLVDNLLASGDLQRAEAEIARLPEDVRQQPAVKVVLGRIALTRSEFEQAEAYFQEALTRQPSGAHVGWLATAQWAAGKQEAAFATFKDWLAQNPEDGPIRSELANRYLSVGAEEQALEQFNLLLEQLPDNPVILNNVAWLERERNPQRALEHIKRADQQAPGSAEIKDTYAVVQLANGNVAQARALIDQALEIAPGNPSIEFNRARILLAMSGSDAAAAQEEARATLRRLLESPDFAEAEAARALLRGASGTP